MLEIEKKTLEIGMEKHIALPPFLPYTAGGGYDIDM